MGNLKLGYKKPKSILLCDNISLGKGGGGGGGSVELPVFRSNGIILAPPGYENDGVWVSAQGNAFNWLIIPKDENRQRINPFAETKPFKIHIRVYPAYITPSGGADNALFGITGGNYYQMPALHPHTDYMWMGISENGSGWTSGCTLEPDGNPEHYIQNGKVYTIECGWDGSVYFIYLYDADKKLIATATNPGTGHYPYTGSYEFDFGGLVSYASLHGLRNWYLDVSDAYIEVDGQLLWGVKKDGY